MRFRTPIVITGVAIAAVGPIQLHGHPTRDCNPRIELCAPSDVVYLPDEPAQRQGPAMIFASPTAAYSSSAPSGPMLSHLFKTT